ncbi:MFS transporter, partial [Streptomyces sp. DSM 44915]|nr:MFS transporter [Streptomyces sp. DSM 44915]
YPVVGAAIGVWGVAPVFIGCGVFGSVGVGVALVSGAVRSAELAR